MFTNCSGKCCVCSVGAGCVAGDGDDYFSRASKEQVIRRLDEGRYPEYTKTMKQYLLSVFQYDYDAKKEEKNRE